MIGMSMVSITHCHEVDFIYLGFYVTFNTVQVISRQVVGRSEKTSTYSSSLFYTVNCRPTASNYQLSHLRPCREPNPGLRGGRRECCHEVESNLQSYRPELSDCLPDLITIRSLRVHRSLSLLTLYPTGYFLLHQKLDIFYPKRSFSDEC